MSENILEQETEDLYSREPTTNIRRKLQNLAGFLQAKRCGKAIDPDLNPIGLHHHWCIRASQDFLLKSR